MYSIKNLWGEPIALWATVQSVVVAAISFGWLTGIGLQGQHSEALAVGVISALAAVHLALFTHKTLLAPIVQLVTAFANFLVIYGTHISSEQTAIAITAITAISAAWHRERTSPLPKASLALAA